MSTSFQTPSVAAQTLSITGADALDFAQSQFSSDVKSLAQGQWQFGAWLSAQGRVRQLFQLARVDDQTLVLLLRGGSAETFERTLRPFVFRSRVKLSARVDCYIADAPTEPMHTVRLVDSIDHLRWGSGDHSIELVPEPGKTAHWRLRQLRLGWPWLPQSALDGDMLPSAISLMRLRGASLEKGCYPGQEIVARLHYRGGSKRHMHTLSLDAEVTSGEKLRTPDGAAVALLQVVTIDTQCKALAVLPDQTLATTTDAQTLCFERGVTATILRSWPD